MPGTEISILIETLQNLGPWVGGGITLKKPIERLLGAPVDRLLLGYEARTAAGKDRAVAIARVETEHAVAELEAELAQRTLLRIASQARQEQINIEAVAVAALKELQADPPPEQLNNGTPLPEVDDEFLSRFERGALDASSERLQILYGRVLAGEIRKPGTFSLQTLAVLGTFDKIAAEAFERVGPCFASNFSWMPSLGPFSTGPRLADIITLTEAGLITSEGLTNKIQNTLVHAIYGGWTIVFEPLVSPNPGQIMIKMLTRAGARDALPCSARGSRDRHHRFGRSI